MSNRESTTAAEPTQPGVKELNWIRFFPCPWHEMLPRYAAYILIICGGIALVAYLITELM
jgi:hypothetical protein